MHRKRCVGDFKRYEFSFPKKKKDGTWETEEEMMDRIDKEDERDRKREHINNIRRIMKKGFSSEQAEYLYKLEQLIGEAANHKSWRDAVF